MSLEKLNDALKKGNITNKELSAFFNNYADVNFTTKKIKDIQSIAIIYCEGMIDSHQLNEFYYPVLNYLSKERKEKISNDQEKILPPLNRIHSISDLVQKVFSGYLILFKEGQDFFYGLDIAKIPQRTPEESKVDISIKGPKDAFTEELNINISLIRKRLKTSKLYNESFTLGSVSQTKVSLLYLADSANPEMIKEIKKRLTTFQSESILGGGQLEQWLADRTFSLFPLFDYITRPDYAIACMLRGRFVLVIDGSPMVLIGPANIFLLIKSPEDIHFPYYIVIFQRAFRMLGILISIFLPGFYVAVTSVDIGQLPFQLLATIFTSRQGIPLPIALETFLILGFFELLREAGLRMPTAVGQTVSIVGGLIIGDAAIRGGLASPTLVVIVALTAVATYTLVNQSLTGTVSILRLYILILCSILGIYGFFIGMISILVYISHLESFTMSYLEPVSSLTFTEYLSALSFNPFKRRKLSARIIQKEKR